MEETACHATGLGRRASNQRRAGHPRRAPEFGYRFVALERGDRQLNYALHVMALAQIRYDSRPQLLPAQPHMHRRLTIDLSNDM
jgi:hypothetical protein